MRGKARDRRFYRRGALCASAWQGPTNAEAFHFHPTMRQEAGWPTGHMPRSSPCLPIRACGARPSAGWTLRGETALGEKGPKIGEGRFSRRGAVSAPGRYGRTNGKALRCHRCLYEKPAAKKGQCWGQRYASLPGVRSPPLRGGRVGERGLAGKGRRWRESRFSRRGAVSASAW